MIKLRVNFRFLLAAFLFSNCYLSYSASSSPVEMLQNTVANITKDLDSKKGHLTPKIVSITIEKYLLLKVDVAGMSRSVVGRAAWLKATPSERAEFTRLFTDLVVRTYSNPLSEYKDEKINFLPFRGDANAKFVRVKSIVLRSNGGRIPLDYSLVRLGQDWKIYDISVEGVSLLQSFRTQFSSLLQSSSLAQVIDKMKKSPTALKVIKVKG